MALTAPAAAAPAGARASRRAMALTPDLVARCFRVEPDPGPHPDYVYLDNAALT